MKEHFITVNEIAETHDDVEGMIGGTHASFSKHFGLKKVGVHYFKIPPSRRTSRPHAESLEEEFVYVISGDIDLWFNGKIKKMMAGDCIGFPAGTGIGHTFINNSDVDVELFVAGDRTKKENQYRFHLEPNLQEECGANWWSGMPDQTLGKHDGLSGSFDSSLVDNTIFTFNGLQNLPSDSYSYPGDDETFTNGVCLSRKFDMKSIAVWLERIPIGKRSSWPHAHSVEEEFVYVLEGEPTVWLNGVTTNISPETAIDFKAGSGVAHTLINKTKEDVLYLCVGECEPVDDKIVYPLHYRRNEEVRKEGGFWKDYPKNKINLAHDGSTDFVRMALKDKLTIFNKSESLINPELSFKNKIWAMWLPKKRFEKVEESRICLKCVTENNLWNEMLALRSDIEREFGEFDLADIEGMILDIKKHIDINCGSWFIAYLNNEVVGEIGFLPIVQDDSLYWRLQDVDIISSHRGKSLGTDLLKSVILLAKNKNVTGICLRADEEDWKKDWYLRFGFDYLDTLG